MRILCKAEDINDTSAKNSMEDNRLMKNCKRRISYWQEKQAGQERDDAKDSKTTEETIGHGSGMKD